MAGKNIFAIGMTGIRKALRNFVWIIMILIPISLGTAVLEWSGWLVKTRFLLDPFMGFLSLPGEAALPLIVGMLNGIYGAVAAMSVLSLTKAQMTLVAVFLLIAHGLIQESLIQGKAGLHPFKAVLIRLLTAVATVWVLALFLDTTGTGSNAVNHVLPQPVTFTMMLIGWLEDALILMLQILVIITMLMTILEIAKQYGWIEKIVGVLHPLFVLFGLKKSSGSMWLAGIFFGILYGAAVIVDEAREGTIEKEELKKVHLTMGINHGVIEDPLLFLPLGLNLLLLYIPRMMAAIIVVQLFNLWVRFRKSN